MGEKRPATVADAKTTGPGANRKTGTPSPSARQTEPQDPDPLADCHDRQGTRPAGQAPSGNDTRQPPPVASPTGASAETSAADRCANCQGCEPSDLNTCTRSDGKPPRPMASMPDAQPTNNRPDQGAAASSETKPTASPTSAADGLREPQRPTSGKLQHIENIYITK